jgi:hypothetical protein
MRYTFKQYCDITKGIDIQHSSDEYIAFVFKTMALHSKNLYCIEGTKWVFQKSGRTMYFSYVFIVEALLRCGMRKFQITEYLHERLSTQGFKYKKLECRFLPEF